MPFTFAHPAIIVPLEKKFSKTLNFTALILGSMSPDFEYFIKFKVQGILGHSFIGFLCINLPLVFIAAFLWHCVVKQSFISNLPTPLDAYFSYMIDTKLKIKSIKALAMFVISALIGMSTHVFWDAFTHKSGLFVKLIPTLSSYLSIFNFNIPLYKILQHCSTLIGFAIIIIYLRLKTKENKVLTNYVCFKIKFLYWASIFLIATGITIYRSLYFIETLCLNNLGDYIVSFISTFVISIVIVSFISKQN